MKDYGRDFRGSVFIHEVSTLPTWSASYDRRIVKCTDTQRLYLGISTGWVELNPVSNEEYSSSWNGVTTISPSKNALYNKLLYLDEYAIKPGTIIISPTENVPVGCVECDGSLLSKTSYASLYSVLGGRYGSNSTHFAVPDYRGWFLRGWTHTSAAGIDDDAATRLNRGDGTIGNNVGTKQYEDTNQPVPGPYTVSNYLYPSALPFWSLGSGSVNYLQELVIGGNETRPDNIYVMFCIKY